MLHSAKQILLSSRPVSWINTAFPFAASYLVVHGSIDITWLIGTIYFLIPYNVLMYGINDVFDYESDKLNARKNGAEGIVLDKNIHSVTIIAALVLNIPFLAYLLLQSEKAAIIVLGVVLFSQFAYTLPGLRFKEKPFLDSITSACHFVGPMLYGLVLAGWDKNYLVFVISFFLWAMASHAFGAVQDIVPDQKAGLKSIATFLSARWTVRMAVVLYLTSSQLLFLMGTSPMLVGIVGLLYVVNIIPYWDITNKNSSTANNGWKRFMKLNYFTGFVITILLIFANR